MKVLADENVPGRAVHALRDAGHDVVWVRDACPGADDLSVLEMARGGGRVLLTFDKDFAELVFRDEAEAPDGVILVRASSGSPDGVARLLVRAFSSRDDWPGHFGVIEANRVRLVPLPTKG